MNGSEPGRLAPRPETGASELPDDAGIVAGLRAGDEDLFAQVIDQFFALYVQMNSFIELVILSHQSGEELFRCKPRSGSMALS